jgi:hypothetical protein
MRVVGIAIITALLSAGCAIQAGDPQSEETQRPNELVGISGGDQPGVSAHPQSLPRNPFGQDGPSPFTSPNPSPWTGGNPPAGDTNGNGGASGSGGGNGSGGNTDNPNPSPWTNPSSPHFGGVGGGTGNAGTGG